MTNRKDRPPKPPRKSSRDPADAHGDFYFDELMTPQPDATREFFRSRLLKPAKAPKSDKDKR